MLPRLRIRRRGADRIGNDAMNGNTRGEPVAFCLSVVERV